MGRRSSSIDQLVHSKSESPHCHYKEQLSCCVGFQHQVNMCISPRSSEVGWQGWPEPPYFLFVLVYATQNTIHGATCNTSFIAVVYIHMYMHGGSISGWITNSKGDRICNTSASQLHINGISHLYSKYLKTVWAELQETSKRKIVKGIIYRDCIKKSVYKKRSETRPGCREECIMA